MADEKHTPGPWEWDEDGNLYSAAALAEYRAWKKSDRKGWVNWPKAIVQTDSGVYGPFGLDRHLIAAAPLLLEALEACYAKISAAEACADLHESDATKLAYAAIKRAYGDA